MNIQSANERKEYLTELIDSLTKVYENGVHPENMSFYHNSIEDAKQELSEIENGTWEA